MTTVQNAEVSFQAETVLRRSFFNDSHRVGSIFLRRLSLELQKLSFM